jgi:hypothetical protein
MKEETKNLPYVCIRTYSAGVHFGYLKSCAEPKDCRDGYYPVELVNARRMWSWDGAKTLSDLAQIGSKKQKECKFTLPVDSIKLMAIEIINVTDKAKKNLDEIPIWTLE